ncbi:MAG: hypothetical protein ACI8YQ_003789 [Polaribacter sp.]|jgi:uncharacterized protein (DUF1697 family)
MPTYISLLRAINVGGNNKIKMADLKALYESLDFKNVKTYIQSGNVIFDSKKKSQQKLEILIAEKIKETFGHDIALLIRTKKDFETLVGNNPFPIKAAGEEKQRYVMFLQEEPDSINVNKLLEKIEDWPEQFELKGKEAYLNAVNGYGRTKLNSNFVERNLKVKITARNWKSVIALLGFD